MNKDDLPEKAILTLFGGLLSAIHHYFEIDKNLNYKLRFKIIENEIKNKLKCKYKYNFEKYKLKKLENEVVIDVLKSLNGISLIDINEIFHNNDIHLIDKYEYNKNDNYN